jgi:uroporphyrinogen decarboxylase
LTPRERVIAALRCEKPDRIPRALGFFPQSLPAIGSTAPEDYFHLDVGFVEFNPPAGQDRFLRYLDRLPADIHLGNTAQLQTYHEWDYHPERNGHSPLGSIRSIEELAAHVFPDLTHPSRYRGLSGQVARWHHKGLAVAGSPPHLGGELFETACRLRGFNNFLIDMLVNRQLAHYLLDQLTAIMIHNSLILAKAGVDILLLDDDVAMPTQLMISPAMWREFFKPRLTDAINIAREEAPELLVFYHSDGNFTQLIPELVDIGINVINPVQPDCMDAAAIKQEFGNRLALWGTVGTAPLWQYGTPAQIRTEVKQRIDTLGPEGLLLAPAYDIDFAPLENLSAFAEAVQDCFK